MPIQNRQRVLAAAAAIIAMTGGLYGCLSSMRDTTAHLDPAQKTAAVAYSGKGITIYTAGDIAGCKNIKPLNSGAAKTAALIAQGLANDKDAAVLTLGDNTYPVGLLAEFNDCYEPTWGQFKSRTYPSPGNHEYYTLGAPGYYGYFGAAAGPAQLGYYSFNLGAWHIVSLNSNLQNQQHLQQLTWLKSDLAQHPVRCTLAYWHHPVYSSGGHGNNQQMKDAWDILHDANADVVLAAHDHDYERFAPQDGNARRDDKRGIREFVVGTGGVNLTSFAFRKPNSEVSNNSTLGVLKLVLMESGYEWEFLSVSGNGFSDRGAASCH